MHDAIARIHETADVLREEHARSDRAGQLTERAARILKESGGMRLLQAKEHGGFAAHPNVFYEWVRTVARYNPSAGWIAGVVGVHPWEIALLDPKLQSEIYGADPDTWVASPYAPNGRARPVDGGFSFSGEWQYSTGTDLCDWVILGGFVTDAQGELSGRPEFRHFVLPRADYEVVADSWHVMGLSGTGSKNVRMTSAFVPEYRTVGHVPLCDGAYAQRRPNDSLYHLPFGFVFSAAIASATLGIAQGAIDAYRDYVRTRVSVSGVVGKTDPYQQQALAEAEADVAAAVVHLDWMTANLLERLAAGSPISPGLRLEYRRNQVRGVQRVLGSIDQLFARAGSGAVWTTRPLERFWRDLRTGASHMANTPETTYPSWANHELQTGGPINTFY